MIFEGHAAVGLSELGRALHAALFHAAELEPVRPLASDLAGRPPVAAVPGDGGVAGVRDVERTGQTDRTGRVRFHRGFQLDEDDVVAAERAVVAAGVRVSGSDDEVHEMGL